MSAVGEFTPRPSALSDRPRLLEAGGITRRFGGVVAVNDVSFSVPESSIVSIIGPNGAGKTTFFNILTGMCRPSTGWIEFVGNSISGARPDQIAAAGVLRTFQNIRLFGTMTALENVLVGQHSQMKAGIVGSILRSRRVSREERGAQMQARETLEYVGLPAAAFNRPADVLSYGDQRRVEIARALAASPRLLLLDEPTAGMNPNESKALVEFIKLLRVERGVAVLLIEHDMNVVMSASERVTVLDSGRKIAEGTPEQVRDDERVIEAYLGKEAN